MIAALAVFLLCAPGPQDAGEVLPSEPEVRDVSESPDELRFTVRGRDASAAAFLARLAENPRLHIEVDGAAEVPLRTTRLTVDLRAREPDVIVDLIGAATGIEVRPLDHGHSFRLLGPPPPGEERPRIGVRRAAIHFYELALLRQRDASTAARALRGLGDLHRTAGDYAEAYTAYETLLSRFGHSSSARNAELLLAECYARVGDPLRARKVLLSYLDRAQDPTMRELALRRLLRVLLDEGRYLEIEGLRDEFDRMERITPETLSLLADAGAALVDRGAPEAAILLLEGVYRRDPNERALVGPVLAQALLLRGDVAEAAMILRVSVRRLHGVADSAPALLALASLAMENGELPTALLLGQRTLSLPGLAGSEELRAHLVLARVYEALGVHGRSRAHLEAVERLGAPGEAARMVLRSAYDALEEGRAELARLLFQEALRHPSTRIEASLGSARALADAGDVERALDVVRGLSAQADLTSDVLDRVHHLEVDLLRRAGRFAEARAALTRYWPAEGASASQAAERSEG